MNLIKIHSRPNEPKYPYTQKNKINIVGLPIKITQKMKPSYAHYFKNHLDEDKKKWKPVLR